jgi:glycine/D-amino acid oxidase-like deaminating enzyme
VAIVGAGIGGLTAALFLARAGVDVRVLEAREPGFGASGRNGGLVVPNLPRLEPGDVLERLGPDRGARLLQCVADGADRIFALVHENGIACDARQGGWLCPAHAPALAGRLEARVQAWRPYAPRLRFLGRAETVRLTGCPGFHGAYLDPAGGRLNPLAYVRGLAVAALHAGAHVHGRTMVTSLERIGQRWRLASPRGRVTADRVLVFAHLGLGRLVPQAARSFLPLEVYQSATAPLAEAARAAILPEGQVVSDTRRNLFSYSLDGDGRLITGGMATVQCGALRRLQRVMAGRLERRLPGIGVVDFSYRWRGTAALTPDFLPRRIAIGPGAEGLVACNGRGLVMTTVLAEMSAGALLGRDESPLPLAPARPIRGAFLARHLPALLLPLADLRDRLD